MIKRFSCIGTLTLLLVAWTCPALSEPYSPSCESAVEKVFKARQNLIPSQQAIDITRSRERGAYAELAVCTSGGIFTVTKAYACNDASWQAPDGPRRSLRRKTPIWREGRNLRSHLSKPGECVFLEPSSVTMAACLRSPSHRPHYACHGECAHPHADASRLPMGRVVSQEPLDGGHPDHDQP
jgi:hypothetical protein